MVLEPDPVPGGSTGASRFLLGTVSTLGEDQHCVSHTLRLQNPASRPFWGAD